MSAPKYSMFEQPFLRASERLWQVQHYTDGKAQEGSCAFDFTPSEPESIDQSLEDTHLLDSCIDGLRVRFLQRPEQIIQSVMVSFTTHHV
eukprot:3345378-Amphidinium_carterae.1